MAARKKKAASKKAASKKKGAKKKPARRKAPARRRGWIRPLGRVAAVAAVVVGFWASSWVLEQDRIVRAKFEGRRFSVPSRVLSSPTVLYPGLDWKRIELPETLGRLGYREDSGSGELPSGRYRWGRGRLRVHLRAFDHPSRQEPSRDVGIRLAGNFIDSIVELPGQGEVGMVVLEPELVGAYYGPEEREQRDLVRLDELPRHLSDAVLAVEDQRFESHHGVDFRRILGAFLANVRAGGIRQGASTLTQQLVKNFFLTPEQTLQRKFTEAVMALLVEARYDKEAILESYLNEIYLGQRGSTEVHGVGEASRFYFGKRAQDLSVSESALIAAIVQSPNRLSPHRHPDRALDRRNLVLGLMLEQGRITRAEHDKAHEETIRVASVTPEVGESRYFLDVLRRQLPEVYDRDVLAAEGLEIYSTLDPRLQRAAVRALLRGLERIEAKYPALREEDPQRRLQGCLIAMRPQTGEVLALAGGRSYGDSQFDRCTQARRQAGSTFKPFVYIAGLEPRDGTPAITTASLLDDAPLEVDTNQGVWKPRNYDHEFRGPVTVRHALEGSLNIPVIRLGMEIGVDRVVDVARRLGVTSDLPRVPSLALGTAALAPIEVARAYATIANGGIRPQPHTFEDVVARGETLERRKLRFERVLDAGVAYLATSLLEGVVDRGTGRRVRSMGIEGPVAGKTGTTDDEYDLWFVGFTPELVAVVWVGFDEPRTIGVQSSWGALPIWVDFVKDAYGKRVRGLFSAPPSVRELEINPETGAVAMAGCPVRANEVFLRGTEPTRICDWQNTDGEPDEGSSGRRPQRGGSFWDRIFGR